ncbi:MAG: sulfotransferase [Alphaproteobacteria bacterium]|nr:sulfotransferase [Alphaproteobacteria bacterium]
MTPQAATGAAGARAPARRTNGRAPAVDAATLKAADALVAEGRAGLERGDRTTAELRARQALERFARHVPALQLLYDLKRNQAQKGPDYEDLLRKIVRLRPNSPLLLIELAFLLFARGERVECERHARRALRQAPRHPRAHGLLGLIFTETNRGAAGEYHFRRVLELEGETPRVLLNLANCLKSIGKIEEAEAAYKRTLKLDSKLVDALLGLCRLEEARRDIARAWDYLKQAEAVAGPGVDFGLTRAILYGREKKNDPAIEELSKSRREGTRLTAIAQLERGRLYDKMNRFDEAWADFVEGKRLCREVQGRRYNEALATDFAKRLTRFFQRARMELLPRASIADGKPQPIFIVGFPRSGTTMVEQTITAHPRVAAGDELPFISQITNAAPRLLASELRFPECLADLWMGDNRQALDQFRDVYLQRAGQLGIWEEGADFFTDKMPLNETHLGLIHLMFPKSPIIHVRRHPLDILVSNFSNFLTHGFEQAFDLKTSAAHIALIDRLVEHYRREIDLNYLEVRYEDVVTDQERLVRQMLEFLGLPFDARCLKFHENQRYARTASYAQVTEKLYDSSLHRYRNYRRHLDEAVEILKPAIERLGYAID